MLLVNEHIEYFIALPNYVQNEGKQNAKIQTETVTTCKKYTRVYCVCGYDDRGAVQD